MFKSLNLCFQVIKQNQDINVKMENKTSKIEFMKKEEINFNESNTSDKAKEIIESAADEDNLILKITINSNSPCL